jgi:RimJ/RimL family protein N-acetyltransferase
MSVLIRAACQDDLPFIQATERRPGFDALVGRWDEARHRREMDNPSSAYLLGERGGEVRGFVILQNLDDPHGNVLLKRIAVREPGAGFGQAFLQGVMAWVFARPGTHRLWLDVFLHNERARHVYRSLGFREDGLLREAYVTPAGVRVSQALMSILRPEWEERQASGVAIQ